MVQPIKRFTNLPQCVHRTRRPADNADAGQAPTPAETKLSNAVDDEPLRWFREEVVPEYINRGEKPRIDDVQRLALQRFPSMTRRAFYLKVWTPGAPKEWSKGGRPKGPTRKDKAKRR